MKEIAQEMEREESEDALEALETFSPLSLHPTFCWLYLQTYPESDHITVLLLLPFWSKPPPFFF